MPPTIRLARPAAAVPLSDHDATARRHAPALTPHHTRGRTIPDHQGDTVPDVQRLLEAAIEFHTATVPDSEIRNVARTGKDGPIASAEFVVGGHVFMGYNEA